MATYRFPVVLLEDPATGVTAIPLDHPHPGLAAFAASRNQAVKQLKDFLNWSVKQPRHFAEPDFLDPQVLTVKVTLRPEYHVTHRIHMAETSIPIRIHCVHGRQSGGLRIAVVPLFGIEFYYHADDDLKSLVQRYVEQGLGGKTPAELACALPASSIQLDEVLIRVPNQQRDPEEAQVPPTLEQIAEPLGNRRVRRQFTRAWERDDAVAQVIRKTIQERTNVLLVGEPGVGKTTVLVEAVQRIEREQKREGDDFRPFGHLFWQTSAGRIIAGMKYLGQWEERCEELIEEISSLQGVLCVDRLLDLLTMGGAEVNDSIAAFLVPYLRRGELRMIVEATPSELDACRRLLPGLVDLFQTVFVPAFDRPAALRVLDQLMGGLQTNLKIRVAPGVVDRIYQLFHRFMPYEVFPGRAVAFSRELVDRLALRKSAEVQPEQVTRQFMDLTGLPEVFLRDEHLIEREQILVEFRQQVLGQEEACQAAADLVLRFKAGLNDPQRPVGVLLFCGPTGVGKTEMAHAITRMFFGAGQGDSRERLIRLDMSEYAGFDAVERLLGSSSGQPSPLVQRIRQQPFCVVLLDEIEKARPEVFDVLLGVFDEGRLTDRFGRQTNFRSAILLMTSNLGEERQANFGFDASDGSTLPRYSEEAMAFFRPEFFNRLDGVVTFRPLSADTIRAITYKELKGIAGREGLCREGLQLHWRAAVIEQLAQIGFDPRYGARPLQRTIEQRVVAPLACFLLSESKQGRSIEVNWDIDQGIVFRWAGVEEKA